MGFLKSISVIYNLKDKARTDDLHEEYDEIETILALKKEIENLGLIVNLLQHDDEFLPNVIRDIPEMAFNIAEGIGKTRGRESQVPCVLESLGVPYSGSDPISLGITLDKYLTNVVLKSAGVPVPEAVTVETPEDAGKIKDIFKRRSSCIVKPRWEGSSKGIFDNSVASDSSSAAEKAMELLKKYEQPVLIEEFLPKDEITCGLCGNGEPEVLGMMRISPREKGDKFVYSIEQKRDWKKKIMYEDEKSIPERVRENVARNARAAFRALGLRDVARMDFRLDSDLTPKIIDVNPLPGLSPAYSDLVIMCRLCGVEYGTLVGKIVKAALTRCGFTLPR